MALAALEQVAAWQPPRIARSIEPLTDHADAMARNRGFTTPPKECRVPHMLGIRRDRGWPDDLQERFGSLGIYVSKRGDAMRVSPYLYNDQDDVERLFEAIDQLEVS